MADDPNLPDEPTAADEAALAVVARHALHDEELVAALAAGGLDDEAGLARARSFVERCSACRSLHDDVAAIGAALRIEALGTVTAPRDYRLTVEDAHRLGGRVSTGGLLGRLRRSMATYARPLGASMAALGIVGLLVGSVSFGAGSAAGPSAAGVPGAAPTAAAAAAPSIAPAELQASLATSGDAKASDRAVAIVPGPSTPGSGFTNEAPRDSATTGANPVMWLLAASLFLLVAGIGLVVVAIRRNP